MENPITLIEAHQKRVDKLNGELELPANALSIDLLRAIYRNRSLALPVRMRAAMACLPFETPKLAVTALVTEHDFATILEKRIQNYERVKNGGLIEANREPVEVKPPLPRIADRRYRRF